MAQQVGCGYSVVLTDGGGFDGNAGKPALFHRRDDINIHILGKDVRLLVDAVGAQIGLVEHTDQGPGIGVRPGRVNLKVGAQGGDQLLRRGPGGDIVQCLGVLYLLGVRGIALASATIVAAMPTAVAAYIIAEKYQVATEDSSLGIVVDTALSAVSIPLLIVAFQYYGLL